MSDANSVRLDRCEKDIIEIKVEQKILTQRDNDIILKEHQKLASLENSIKEHIDISVTRIETNLSKKIEELDSRLTKLENKPAEQALKRQNKLLDRVSDKAIDRIATIIVVVASIAIMNYLGGG